MNDDRQPHIIDTSAVCIFLVILIIVVSFNGFYQRINAYLAPAPISTPAVPTPAPAPIYYQPVPTLYPVPAAPQRIDNSDHRICIFVVDCSQADK